VSERPSAASQRPLDTLRGTPVAAAVIDALSGESEKTYVVGGAVRDVLLGREPLDLDITVDGDELAVARRVAKRLGGDLRHTHQRFMTATVVVDGRSYDFARTRVERYAHPGALPEVTPAHIEEDLRRRDFTINAVALELVGEPGRLLSVDDLGDLEARRLRVLHDRSFADDPTRLLRLSRYATRLGLAVEPATARLAAAAIQGGALGTISGPRLGHELRLTAREPDPVSAFERLDRDGVLAAISEALSVDAAVAGRALALLPPDGRREPILFAAITRELAAGDVEPLLTSLGLERGEIRPALDLAGELSLLSRALRTATRPSAIAALLRGRSPTDVALIGALGAESQARRWFDELRHVKLEIDGEDVRGAGIREGPAVGAALDRALAARLDGEAVGREAELRAALASGEDPAAAAD
jgi:tRNA nucleotidyltransferase (CCA-adding enzyme)